MAFPWVMASGPHGGGFHEGGPRQLCWAHSSVLRALQRACSSPRNECRSAVRIKVLDVLSFVLLINRQFYEVCTQV